MTIEQIVRPFQSPTPLNTRRVIPSSTKEAPQTATIIWGKPGTMPVAVESAADQPVPMPGVNVKTKKVTDRNVEKSRETETIRIENPNDPSQYVIVERVKKITFDKISPPTLQGASSAGGVTAYPSSSSAKNVTTFGQIQINTSEYQIIGGTQGI